MARSTQYVCVKDRECFSVHDIAGGSWHCPRCGKPGVEKYYTWRPPKKSNDKAWKLIEQGDWLWDKKYRDKRVHPGRYRDSDPNHKSLLHDLFQEILRKKIKDYRW